MIIRKHVEDGQGNVLEDYEYEVPDVPLDATGALAALLVVNGTLTAVDAANAVGLTPEQLAAEATAWSVASPMSPASPS